MLAPIEGELDLRNDVQVHLGGASKIDYTDHLYHGGQAAPVELRDEGLAKGAA